MRAPTRTERNAQTRERAAVASASARSEDGWMAVFFEFWAHVLRHPEHRASWRCTAAGWSRSLFNRTLPAASRSVRRSSRSSPPTPTCAFQVRERGGRVVLRELGVARPDVAAEAVDAIERTAAGKLPLVVREDAWRMAGAARG